MGRRYSLLALLTLLAGGLFTGCAVTPVADPAFAPAEPDITIVSAEPNGAIYQASTNRFFFEDIRARRVGDVIIVILDERTDATKSASTSANKGTTIGLPSPTLFGGAATARGREILANDITASSDFAGTADSSQSNRLNGSVAVVVDKVLSNGNLWIRGEKRLTLNQGSEVVKVSGLIRPADITPQNTVQSNQIAAASISYGGTGLLADSNRAGWLTRFFNSAVWPF
ncbi:MAG: flagellar basal body L-ring protein FlgH [Granulosicoccus sp.]|nr:flagellar basal body L-ring protein FlgH [Granulosicoccus sp.]